jgi:protein arginine N-methyltransferase 1
VRVYAIERGPIARVGAALTEENRVSGITWLERHSRDAVLPEPVDVVVSECLGVLAAGGTMLQAVVDLRRRHLRAGGAVVPRAVSVFVAPAEAPADHRWVAQWNVRRHGMTFGAAASLAWNNMYSTLFSRRAVVGAPVCIGTVDLAGGAFDGTLAGEGTTEVRRAATVHGLAAWFEADLADGVVLSTAPGEKPTVWRQVFLPFARPVRARRGALARLALRIEPAPEPGCVVHVDFQADVAGRRFAGSTRRSYPGSPPATRSAPRSERKPFFASS